MPTCKSCLFWNTTQLCRRYPEYQFRGPSDWCGEHKPVAQIPPEVLPPVTVSYIEKPTKRKK